VAINGPSVSASFSYDALGRRISKTINGQTTTYHYDGLDIVRELGGGGEASYLRTLTIDEALTRTDATNTLTYLADILGSTVALADSSVALSTEYTYEPFGATQPAGPASANSFQFTGRENDGTGFYYYRARYYDPHSGRFLSEDPILTSGNPLPPTVLQKVLSEPQLFHGYAYATGNPVNYTDPEGFFRLSCKEFYVRCAKCVQEGQKCAEEHSDPEKCLERGEDVPAIHRIHLLNECYKKNSECDGCVESLLKCGFNPAPTPRPTR
jgi:RHS repeat-associated protein